MLSKFHSLKLAILFIAVPYSHLYAQAKQEQKGFLKEEIINNIPANYSVQSLTAVESTAGLLISFAARNYETSVSEIWLEKLDDSQWTLNSLSLKESKAYFSNPVLFQLPKDDLLLFYKIGSSPANWKGAVKMSRDNGRTWNSGPDFPPGVNGPSRNKPLLLNNGNLLCPDYTVGSQGFNNYLVHFEITNDKGKIWKKTEALRAGKDINALNPAILNHGNGKLQLVAQSLNGLILSSLSYDNGNNWWPLAKTELPNTGTIDAITLKDGRQALIYSHRNSTPDFANATAYPLNLALSEDGENWSAAFKLEDSPSHEFSEPVLVQTNDNLLHVFYIWKGTQIKHVTLDPKQLKLKKIKKGGWPQ